MIDQPPAKLSVSDVSQHGCPLTWDDVIRLRILLDGVEQRQVLEYDCEAGTILRNKLDEKGHAQVHPDKRDEVWTEAVTGNVTVEWKDPA